MALCGLRWGEATGLVWDDVALPAGAGPGWLTVRRTWRPTSERWLDPGEDPEWGPLENRDLTDSRRVPVPPLRTARLHRYRNAWSRPTTPCARVQHPRTAPHRALRSPLSCTGDAGAARRPPRATPRFTE